MVKWVKRRESSERTGRWGGGRMGRWEALKQSRQVAVTSQVREPLLRGRIDVFPNIHGEAQSPPAFEIHPCGIRNTEGKNFVKMKRVEV